MDCTIENKKLIPLHKVVSAAIVDSWEDVGKMEQLYSHWAARGLKKLVREDKLLTSKKVFLLVNRNTHTATLPPDFEKEIVVAIIDKNWQKRPLKANNNLVDMKNITEQVCQDPCPKCSQDKLICNELSITEQDNIIVINDTPYTQVIIKKLYPNGDYYLETTTPVYNIETAGIDYQFTKEFIVHMDLKDCGCLETNPANIAALQQYCPDIYCNHYAGWNCDGYEDYGSYRVFENSGLIQFDKHYKFDNAYMEYWGFMPKLNGQYMVPEVAFETLVEWVKFKNVDGKKSVSNPDKQWRFNRYTTERDNMEIVIGRISLTQIIQTFGMLPKFDVDFRNDCFESCRSCEPEPVIPPPLPATPVLVVSPPIIPPYVPPTFDDFHEAYNYGTPSPDELITAENGATGQLLGAISNRALTVFSGNWDEALFATGNVSGAIIQLNTKGLSDYITDPGAFIDWFGKTVRLTDLDTSEIILEYVIALHAGPANFYNEFKAKVMAVNVAIGIMIWQPVWSPCLRNRSFSIPRNVTLTVGFIGDGLGEVVFDQPLSMLPAVTSFTY